MSSIYDVDFNQQSVDILSPDKRLPRVLALLQSLIKSVQWGRDLILGSYRQGATAPNWSPGPYSKYDQVIYKKALYMALNDTVSEPNDLTQWQQILPNFIGVDQRITFNCQKCILEFALNRRFNGVFRMPPSTSNSDIYISKIPAVLSGFRVGQTIGSVVGQTASPDKVGLPYPFAQINGYQINVPAFLFSLTSEQEIRDFVNQYNAIGINYLVVQY